MNGEKILIALLGFVIGAASGALVALIFAPMSGRELQYRIKKESELQVAKARNEWMQGRDAVEKRFDDVRARLVPSRS